MKFEVNLPILGFDEITAVELVSEDGVIATLRSPEDEVLFFKVVNSNIFEHINFNIPSSITTILDIDDKSETEIYFIVTVTNPLEKSIININAPLVFNKSNGKMAQFVLEDESLGVAILSNFNAEED
jgi:flagellar assembly factor FliW